MALERLRWATWEPFVAKFTVDTQLFRELGELLVGRESTALVELIKNAYDADARAVYVEGRDLGDPEHGQILIQDNGVGMTREEFEGGFLRIAACTKSAETWRDLPPVRLAWQHNRWRWIRHLLSIVERHRAPVGAEVISNESLIWAR